MKPPDTPRSSRSIRSSHAGRLTAGSHAERPGSTRTLPSGSSRSASLRRQIATCPPVDAVAQRAPRVSLVLKADLRPGVTDGLTAKVETIERYLGA